MPLFGGSAGLECGRKGARNTNAALARGSRRSCPFGPHLVIQLFVGPRPPG